MCINKACFVGLGQFDLQQYSRFSNCVLLLCGSVLLKLYVVVQWCNPPTLQPEQSGGQGSIQNRAPQLNFKTK